MPIFQKYQGLSTDMLKYSVNSNHKDFLNTQFGTTPSNCSRVHQHHSQEDSYAFHKMKLKKYQKLWQSIYKEGPFDQESDPTQQTSSLSKRKTANYVQYKTIAPLTNGQKRTITCPH